MPDTLTVIYDGDCGICNWLRMWAERRDSAGRLHFVPNQTADLDALAPGLTREQASAAAYAVFPDGQRLRGARAIFATLRRVPGLWRWIGIVGALPPLVWLAEPVYRVIAHHRARVSVWLGLAQCRVPEKTSPQRHGDTEITQRDS